MTSHTCKVAVTVPAQTLHRVEATRKRLRRSRSSVVAEALDAWLRARATDDRDRAYLAGYERVPEPEAGEISAAVLATWDSWETPARRRK